MKYTIEQLKDFAKKLKDPHNQMLLAGNWPQKYKNLQFIKQLINRTDISLKDLPRSLKYSLGYTYLLYDILVKAFKKFKNAFILYSDLPVQYKYGKLLKIAIQSYQNSPNKQDYNFNPIRTRSLFNKKEIQPEYYHTTRIQNLKSIFKYGLNPHKMQKRNHKLSKQNVVYLHTYKMIYQSMPKSDIGNVDVVLLTVKTEGLDKNEFWWDENYTDSFDEYIQYHGIIPIENIVHIQPFIKNKMFPVPLFYNIGINDFSESILRLNEQNSINWHIPFLVRRKKQSSVSIAINLNILKFKNKKLSIQEKSNNCFSVVNKESFTIPDLSTYNDTRMILNIYIKKEMAIRQLGGNQKQYNRIIEQLKRRHIKFRQQ